MPTPVDRDVHLTSVLVLKQLLGAAISVGLIISVVACGGLRISHRPVSSSSKPTKVPGVPFYPKKGRCRQEVVWFEPIYSLTLTALIPDKDGVLQSHPRGALVLSRSQFQGPEVSNFTKLINSLPTDEGTVMREWKKVVAIADPHVVSRSFDSLSVGDTILVSRSAAPVFYVDYNDQYYANAKIPLAGSANLDVKVADDGSLSEVSAQIENKTLETITGALPISSVITGELGLSGGKSIAPAAEVEAFQMTVAISGYKHTLGRFMPFPTDANACPKPTQIGFDDADDYKREDMSSASPKPADKSADINSSPKGNDGGKPNSNQPPKSSSK